jgi:tetratricopeptide (TPR) repeat protein
MSAPQSNQPHPRKPKPQGDQISGNIGAGGRFVVVGKNIIQIGTLEIPKKWVIAILLVLTIGFGVTVWYLADLNPRGSPIMHGAFNVAVAEFGEIDVNHRVKPSEIGERLSSFVFQVLSKQSKNLSDNEVVSFWHNDVPKTERGVEINYIPGDSEASQEEAAEQEAHRIQAHLMIYGNLDQNLEFLPKFYVSDLFKGSDTILGQYTLGDRIKIDPAHPELQQEEVTEKTTALFWLIKGFASHNRNRPQEAIKYFEIAADKWQGKGKEIVHFFLGQSALFPANSVDAKPEFDQYIDRAKKEFTLALQINPNYVRAQIGLGSVYIVQASRQLNEDSCTNSTCANQVLEQFVEPAILEYEKARKLPVEPRDIVWSEGAAPLGLGIAYSLKGETSLLSQNLGEAATLFDRAIAQIEKSLDVFTQKKEYRLLGQAYLALGNTYRQKAKSDTTQSQAIGQAKNSYQKCQAVAQDAPYDAVLTKEIVERCKTAIDEL